MAFRRFNGTIDGKYIYTTVTVAGGVPNQEVDILTLLTTAGREAGVGPCRYIKITSDVNITVRFGTTAAAAIPVALGAGVTATTGLEITPEMGLVITSIFITHTGACGAAAASVVIFAI